RLRQLRHVPRRGQVAEGLLVRHARLLRVRDVPGGRGSLLDLARAAAEGGAGDGAGHVLRHVGGRELERRRRGNDDQGERQRLVHELERGEGHDRDLGVERERRLVRAGEDDVRGEARRSLSLPSFVRCPACRGSLDATLRCTSCDRAFRVEDGIPRLLDPTAPGLAAKLRELDAWPELAREQGWYLLDDRVDAALPYLNSRLGWDDRAWGATEYGFRLLLERYVRRGDRVLEIGAAKTWASQHLLPLGCEYVACDLVVDPVIGLGRGSFFEARTGPYLRIQADGERLPFADRSF